MIPTRTLLPCLAAVFLLLGPPSPAAAQARTGDFTWPAHTKNLKVLPKNTSPERLRATMTGFARALGVRCAYCHVGTEGRPLSTYDFASDRKPHKIMARGMMRMVAGINRELEQIRRDEERARAASRRGSSRRAAWNGRDEGRDHGRAEDHETEMHEHGNAGGHEEREVNVECATCHRGAATPDTTMVSRRR